MAAITSIVTAEMPRMPSLYLAHGLPSYALAGYPEQQGLKEAQVRTLQHIELKLFRLFLCISMPHNLSVHQNQQYTTMLRNVSKMFPQPKAIVVMSGHWVTTRQGLKVTTAAHPKTIHEFYGFPPELYAMQYTAPGAPELAARIHALAEEVVGDSGWGIDHGAWTLLCHLYPDANIPVVELSVDNNIPGHIYFELGRKLRTLRDEGVLLMGSGSIVHNLRQLRWGGPPHEWAKSFNDWVVSRVMRTKSSSGDDSNERSLYASFLDAPGGRESVPAPDHYFPFLFALGAAYEDDERSKLIDWIDNGANGMTSFGFGLPRQSNEEILAATKERAHCT